FSRHIFKRLDRRCEESLAVRTDSVSTTNRDPLHVAAKGRAYVSAYKNRVLEELLRRGGAKLRAAVYANRHQAGTRQIKEFFAIASPLRAYASVERNAPFQMTVGE